MSRRHCPICGKPLALDGGEGGEPGDRRDEAARLVPFCSTRCRDIDLGMWLDGEYRITSPVEEEELDEGRPGGSGPDDEAN